MNKKEDKLKNEMERKTKKSSGIIPFVLTLVFFILGTIIFVLGGTFNIIGVIVTTLIMLLGFSGVYIITDYIFGFITKGE
jgi:hypothetical protein